MKRLKLDKTFKINDNYSINCYWDKTRYGFRHIAELKNRYYNTICSAKCCYYNRTWESFEYESVIYSLLNKADIMTKEQVNDYLKLLRANNLAEINRQFSFIGALAKLGSIMTEDKKQANDFQKKILTAGLPGLSFPDDWDNLPEEEKSKRLAKVTELTIK